jgi:hypothetical protein
MAIWYILWPFGIFYGYLVYFSRFGMLYQEKSGNPGTEASVLNRFSCLHTEKFAPIRAQFSWRLGTKTEAGSEDDYSRGRSGGEFL